MITFVNKGLNIIKIRIYKWRIKLPDVEIVYLRKDTNSKSNLKPKINVHGQKKVNHHINSINKKKKTKRKPSFYLAIFIAFILISAFLITTHSTGYLPINKFLKIKSPSGSFKEITYQEIEKNYPITESISEIKNIKHKIFESNEDIQVISDNYKQDLNREGYKLEYQGIKEIRGIDVHYYGYIKGITAVVILITSEELNIMDSKTLVLYSTGNVFSYKNLIDKYSQNL